MQETKNAAANGKFLSFFLGQDEYGIDILSVREITGLLEITPLPRAPAHMLGAANLRGKIVPVVDLSLKLGLKPCRPGPLSCLIIVRLNSADAAVLVDSVNEVRSAQPAELQALPALNSDSDAAFTAAIGKPGGKIKLLLNLNKLLTEEELAVVDSITQTSIKP